MKAWIIIIIVIVIIIFLLESVFLRDTWNLMFRSGSYPLRGLCRQIGCMQRRERRRLMREVGAES